MDLYVSPCRSCDKGGVSCRSRCKRLKAYQEEASTTILVRSFTEQYTHANEVYGRKKYEKVKKGVVAQ